MQKQCNKCLTTFDLNRFSLSKNNKDGYSHQCKKCKAEFTRNYTKTPKGKISQIFNCQKKSSKDRGHPPPSYTKADLENWLYKHAFTEYFNTWVNSNYSKELSPSVDRLDDSKGYCFNNIRLVYWKDNRDKIYLQRLTCERITKQNRSVNQFTLSGHYVNTYPSISMASRKTGIQRTNINACCTRRASQAGGFTWEHTS